jgi:hypothetical protein
VKAAWLLVLTAACRLGFDATDGAPGDDGDEVAMDGDDTAMDGDDTAMDGIPSMFDARPDQQMLVPDASIDAAPTQCDSALVVTPGTRLVANTCRGDLVDGCAGAGKEEVVFEFTPTASGGYNARAFNPGTNNVSNSVARVDAACAATTGACAGLLGTTYTAGQTYYFVVEASSAACVDIEFLID